MICEAKYQPLIAFLLNIYIKSVAEPTLGKIGKNLEE